MFDFKVDDRVKVVNYANALVAEHHNGREGVVTGYDSEYVLVTTGVYTNWPYLREEIELVESAQPEKQSGYFERFDDEYVEDEAVFNALVAIGVEVTKEQYAAALEVGIIIYKAKEAING